MREYISKRRRWLIAAAVIAGFVVLVLLGLYVAVATVDVAVYRAQIEALVSRSLDREVKIGGAIGLERSLTPRFVVEDVSVANSPWASRPLLASAKRLEVQVALLPLLTRRLEVVEFDLVGADVRLERRRDGTPNWVFGRKSDAPREAGMTAEVLAFGIENSRLVYRHADGAEVEVVIDKLATAFAPGRPIPVRFKGRYQQLPIELQLDGGKLEELLSPTAAWSFRAKASVGGLRADVDGRVTDPLKLAGMDVSFRFHGVRAGAIRSILTERVPQLAEYRGAGRFTSGAAGFGFDLRAEGSDVALARLWSGREVDPALSINARQLELTCQGNAATFSELLSRASLKLTAQGAELRWRHSAGKPPLVLSETAVTAETKTGGPIAVGLQGSHAGQAYTAQGTLGTLATLLAAKTPWTIEATAARGDARGEFRGALLKPLAPARLEARFQASAERLATLGEFAGVALPPTGPARVAGKLITHSDKRIELAALEVAVAESRVRGAVTWQPADRPRVRIDVAPSRIRFEDFRSDAKTEAASRAQPERAAAGRVIPDIALGVDLRQSAEIDVALNHVELAEGGTVLASLTGQVRVADGRLMLGPLRSDVGGAPIDARLVFDASVDPARLEAEIDAQSIDYGALLRASRVTDGVQGKLDLRARLTANGNSLYALLNTAAGQIEVVGGEGRIRGKLLEIWGGNLLQILNPVSWAEGGDTELRCVAAQFDVGEGLARSRTLLVDSHNVTVAGEMALNLTNEQIDGLFKPQPKEATLVHLGTPLRLSGTLQAPKVAATESGLVTLGKLAVGIAQPAALVVLFGDLGAKEKNPCAALLVQRPVAPPDAARGQ
jgi:uncharacterized protein involved in outer membrane biogenesis